MARGSLGDIFKLADQYMVTEVMSCPAFIMGGTCRGECNIARNLNYLLISAVVVLCRPKLLLSRVPYECPDALWCWRQGKRFCGLVDRSDGRLLQEIQRR